MPELPEIETIRGVLAKELVGKKCKTVAVTNGKTVRRHKTAKDFRALVEGRLIKSVNRLGEHLIAQLDSGDHLVITLGESGQLLFSKGAKDPKPKYTHAVLTFAHGAELRVVDAQSVAEMFVAVAPAADASVTINRYVDKLAVVDEGRDLRRAIPELANVGLDPLVDQFGWDRLGVAMQVAKLPLRAFLTQPGILSGVGPMYADEALFAASLRYDRSSESLSTVEVRRLHRSLIEILAEAIKQGGTSLPSAVFVDPDHQAGSYQSALAVYDKEGEPCTLCRTPIERATIAKVATYYCPRCQN